MAVLKIVTPVFRLSYTHLFEARAIAEGGTKKYSVSVLIPKTETKFIKELQDGIQKMIADNQDKLKTKKGLKLPLRDGDEERESEEYAGHYFISVGSTTKPIVVDANKKEIIDVREVYSGMYGKVSFNLFAYDTAGNKGIGCGLNAVQKTKDGESLGGTYTAEQVNEDFKDEEDDLLG